MLLGLNIWTLSLLIHYIHCIHDTYNEFLQSLQNTSHTTPITSCNTLSSWTQCQLTTLLHIYSSDYDKDWKLSGCSLSSANSKNSLLIMYRKFVWAILIRLDRCLTWPENVWWLAIIISPDIVFSQIKLPGSSYWPIITLLYYNKMSGNWFWRHQ